ncbi:MAG: cell wall hydrolase [Novosphingobium sp.]
MAAITLLLAGAAVVILGAAGAPGPTLSSTLGVPFSAPFTPRTPARLGYVRVPLPEPLVFAPIGVEQARRLNSEIPFATSVGAAAKPFAFAGGTESRERATDCLASAMWYEAGDDPRGQRAVGQVVLNRVRHPAFPASICGVVFQGSERKTGCQFTFTCDGAMQRIPSESALARARKEARAMLNGRVDTEVGLATHYHTDWVHPVWSGAMDKLAKVDTHLFFRWRGKWGGAGAMAKGYGGIEPDVPALASLSSVHRAGSSGPVTISPDFAAVAEPFAAAFPEPVKVALASAPAVKPSNQFALSVAPGGSAAAPALAALDMCGDKSFCKVVGSLPTSSAPAFLYVRDRRTGVEKTYWDCGAFPRKDAAQCLSPGNRWLAFEGNLQSGGA